MKEPENTFYEENVFNLISKSEKENGKEPGINISAKLASEIVSMKELRGSAKELIPFTEEMLFDYTADKDTISLFHILCGKIESIKDMSGKYEITISALDTEIKTQESFFVEETSPIRKKAAYMQEGDRVTAVVDSNDNCIDLRFGPIYGEVGFELRKRTNKKIGLKCIVSI